MCFYENRFANNVIGYKLYLLEQFFHPLRSQQVTAEDEKGQGVLTKTGTQPTETPTTTNPPFKEVGQKSSMMTHYKISLIISIMTIDNLQKTFFTSNTSMREYNEMCREGKKPIKVRRYASFKNGTSMEKIIHY